MTYLSVCSGIEAATVAWHPLGWQPWAFAEVDKFPSAVLAHHYPNVPNLGDMTRFKDWPDANVDLLVGGTPCQSFSVAGLRAGLDDPRGSLMLVYLAIARRYRPRWLVWENVPGVLSADDGRAFGSLLGGLAELGYGFAYRVLDAQYFGLAQRRKRVFVVGHLGDWRRAAAVLFERESLSGHPAPRRETGTGVADFAISRALTSSHTATGRLDPNETTFIPVVASTIDASYARLQGCSGQDARHGHSHLIAFDARQSDDVIQYGEKTGPLDTCGFTMAVAFRSDASRDGTAKTPSPDAEGRVRLRDPGFNVYEELAPTIDAGAAHGVGYAMQVRRLTPRECERLQGFPDDYTLIPYNGKPAKDGQRYKALGNSMAVPCMRWIGQRIQLVEELQAADAVDPVDGIVEGCPRASKGSRSGSQKGSE